MSAMTERQAAASANVGRRCRWADEQIRGTIVGWDRGSNGYPRYQVAWDEGAPDWWGSIVSAAAGKNFVIEEPEP